MHLSSMKPERRLPTAFQFPLLGIFLCTGDEKTGVESSLRLSIPFAWDFSMHQATRFYFMDEASIFQFPLLGIFLCTFTVFTINTPTSFPFNSLCLGFFYAPREERRRV